MDDGESCGPFKFDEFKNLIREGHIFSETFVWAEEMGDDWCKLLEVEDKSLKDIVMKTQIKTTAMHENPMSK